MFERKYIIKMSKFELILMYLAGFTLGSLIGTAITHFAIKIFG